ncbi:MAG: T9SS type A sorting domain-containing protein, partial [Candidatus Marinimicrobia bacterium]|nr:T9SS type A sorting domain-containing protein [Candidatus Neomarinimicrobiota bacterium]
FDGGGSTTMIIRHEIVNTPSDIAERTVANSFQIVSSAIPDTILYMIQIQPDYFRLFQGDVVSLKTTGWSKNFDLLKIDEARLGYFVDERLGKIDENNRFIAEGVADSGYLYVTYDAFKDSAYIYLKSLQYIVLGPDNVVIDNTTPLQLKTCAIDVDGMVQEIPKSDYTFISLNPDVGIVDSAGVFRGISEGFCQVVAIYETLSDTVTLEVQIGSGCVILDSFANVNDWTLDGLDIDNANSHISWDPSQGTSVDGCMRIDYAFVASNTGRSYLYLKKSIPIYAVPKAIEADFKSDGYRHRVYFVVSDDNQEYFQTYVPGDQTDSTQFVAVQGLAEKFSPLQAGFSFNYPIQFEEIHIRLGVSQGVGTLNTGTLYFDELRILYPDYVHTIPMNDDLLPKAFTLSQNFPNPFNPVTQICYTLPEAGHVTLILYDVRGQEIKCLIDSEQGAGIYDYVLDVSSFEKPLSSGVYLYRLTHGNQQLTKKLLLLK